MIRVATPLSAEMAPRRSVACELGSCRCGSPQPLLPGPLARASMKPGQRRGGTAGTSGWRHARGYLNTRFRSHRNALHVSWRLPLRESGSPVEVLAGSQRATARGSHPAPYVGAAPSLGYRPSGVGLDRCAQRYAFAARCDPLWQQNLPAPSRVVHLQIDSSASGWMRGGVVHKQEIGSHLADGERGAIQDEPHPHPGGMSAMGNQVIHHAV